mmetsp:Transcript_24120/g.53383  ORF Transcript_24120/g.53383 Transcript_24120/m.53383 type:complete len:392 (-) Transcript_24120:476-1651(-)
MSMFAFGLEKLAAMAGRPAGDDEQQQQSSLSTSKGPASSSLLPRPTKRIKRGDRSDKRDRRGDGRSAATAVINDVTQKQHYEEEKEKARNFHLTRWSPPKSNKSPRQVTKYTVRLVGPSSVTDDSPSNVSLCHGVTVDKLRYRQNVKLEPAEATSEPVVKFKEEAKEADGASRKSTTNGNGIIKEGEDHVSTQGTRTTEPSTMEDHDIENRSDSTAPPVPSTVFLSPAADISIPKTSSSTKSRVSDVPMKRMEEDSSIQTGTLQSGRADNVDVADGSDHDIAVKVDIIRGGLDPEAVRNSLYGPNKATNARMEAKLGVTVTIHDDGFDDPGPCLRVGGGAGDIGHYVVIRGPAKNVAQATKVIHHLLVKASDEEDSDLLKQELRRSTSELK